MPMIKKSFAVWPVVATFTVLIQTVREWFLVPALGFDAGHFVSLAILLGFIFFAAFATIHWINPRSLYAAVGVGSLWLSCTVGVGTVVDHYVLHRSWPAILSNYDVVHGNAWILVLIAMAISPPLAYLTRSSDESDRQEVILNRRG